jgi:hypothetical protein
MDALQEAIQLLYRLHNYEDNHFYQRYSKERLDKELKHIETVIAELEKLSTVIGVHEV